MLKTGFSLIEVLIALALIAIITVFATASYEHHFFRIKQSAAKLELLVLAGEMEHYYDHYDTYQDTTLKKLGHVVKTIDYAIEIVKNEQHHYLLAAIPKKKSRSDLCGIFYLDQDGNRSISGAGGKEECW